MPLAELDTDRAEGVEARSVAVVGWSMWPLLRPGARVEFQPLSGVPQLGAILVYDAGDLLVAHRLVRLMHQSDATRLATKGDWSSRCDPPIDPEQVLGEVVTVRFGGFSLPVGNRVSRRIGWLFATFAPVIGRTLRRLRQVSRRVFHER
jgi:hypothetical protein